jgi:Na+/glutamate symporter
MWPFRKKKMPTPRGAMREVVAGLIIGGAIGSIVGSKVLEKVQHEHKTGEDDEEEKADEK